MVEEFRMAGGFVSMTEPEKTTEPEPQEDSAHAISQLVDRMVRRAAILWLAMPDGDPIEILRADSEWQDLSRRVKEVVHGDA
jgi:hypothetical protein